MAIETIPLDTGDPGGPCTWAIATDCCSTWDSLGSTLQASAAAYASLVLWAATGRRFGLCEMTVRPCGQQCTNCFQGSYWSYGTWIPYVWNGQWRNCWCGSMGCTCEPRCQVYLPGPVNTVTSVTQNGLIVPASSWRVDNNKWLLDNVTPIKTPTVGSYVMKHVMERAGGAYVINGVFIAAALIEFGNERLDELKKIISKTHRPLCSFCGGGYPDSHTREWPIPKCACIRARCELLHAVMGKEEG